ncbi:MAG: gamma-glutamyltransferase, partial [Planctomycetota bacterium]
IADKGVDWFYNGPFAAKVGAWMAENGGILTADDFADYRAVPRQPIVSQYRDWTVVGFPPPSSGGVHVAQILNMLECFPLRTLHEEDPAQAWHVVLEAMKLAFADRAYWLGDADYVRVPRGLVDQTYAASLAKRIELDALIDVEGHGTPPAAEADFFGGHTTHLAAADSDGNWVAITATVNTSFGSKVIVPGTGVVLNNQMDDFSAQPGAPNAFGLVGAENNAVGPGKRPLSSMSPTIVLKDGQPVLTVGAAGGPKIITQVVQTLVRVLDLDQSLEAAIAAPRLHHQWLPDRVLAEESAPAEVIRRLRQLGHSIERTAESGVTQAISVNPQGALRGVHDPRVPGKAASATRR